jgi:hypothetical protein
MNAMFEFYVVGLRMMRGVINRPGSERCSWWCSFSERVVDYSVYGIG